MAEGAWHLRKAKSLVKLLALARDHALHREQIMDLLWPELGKRAASNNLRGSLHGARRALAADPIVASHYLASKEERVALCPEADLWVDVEAFEEAARSARATLSEEAAVLYRERGYKGGLQWALNNVGWAALVQEDHQRAETSLEESLTLCLELGDRLTASESLEGMACISGAEGEAERSVKLFGAAEALREGVGSEHIPEEDALREPYLATIRSRLDEATWQAAWAEGLAMSMEQAVKYAFSEEEQTPLISPVLERSPADGSPELTSREMEVATLVARGLTNHQIAQELVLSEHTVITHVRNILKKLNLRSRTQLTLWVTERQLHS